MLLILIFFSHVLLYFKLLVVKKTMLMFNFVIYIITKLQIFPLNMLR